MHVVFDAVAVHAGSAAITLENLLHGWTQLGSKDRMTVLCTSAPEFSVPPGVVLEVVPSPPIGPAAGLWLRSVGVRRACHRLGADALVSLVTASALAGSSCPRGAVIHDLRHELRPHQFPARRRWMRTLAYAWAFRTADSLYCVSERTRDDLVRDRSYLTGKAVLARNGADHVDRWPTPRKSPLRYALAFGQFANKNVDAVLDAWAQFCDQDDEMILRLVGMSRADRAAAESRVARLGISDRVELMPWLDDDAFHACFTGASLVVFPSDFEGFGLPAVEALRLRIPLVISSDPALVEVTGGHASLAADVSSKTLAAAIGRALDSTTEELDAGREYTAQFKWSRMARAIRDSLIQAGAPAT